MAGTQIVGDGGSNINRLNTIKRRLGVNEMALSEDGEQAIKDSKNIQYVDIKRMIKASEPSEINFLDNSIPTTE